MFEASDVAEAPLELPPETLLAAEQRFDTRDRIQSQPRASPLPQLSAAPVEASTSAHIWNERDAAGWRERRIERLGREWLPEMLLAHVISSQRQSERGEPGR